VKKNQIMIMIAVAVAAAAAGFIGGRTFDNRARSNFVSGFGNRTAPPGIFRQNSQTGLRPVNGEIIKGDNESITVKLADGSSKIIILSEKTAINKSAEAEKSDLKTGESVTVFGISNTDGSVTAQNISIGSGMFREMIRGNATPTP